jgi:hypothetical protein
MDDMRKLIMIVESIGDIESTDDVIINCNCGSRILELFEWIKDTSAGGAGITIIASNNGGDQTKQIYIDGDGPDRINLIRLRKTGNEITYADDDFEINYGPDGLVHQDPAD